MPDALPPPEIHDRGRGPEIKGTRITVFDVMDYHPKYSAVWIAELFSLPVPHIELAIQYVEEHRAELMPDYQKMLDRDAAGNPPHIVALLEQAHQRALAFKEQLERQKKSAGATDARSAR